MLRKLCVALVLTSHLSGCAYVHSFRSDLPSQIDTWVEQQEYGKALDTLSYIEPSHKQYALLQEKRENIEQLALRFEDKTIDKASKLQNNKKWHEAALVYESALEKIPASTRLQMAQRKFLAERGVYLGKHDFNLLLSRAEQLGRDLPELKEIQRVVPRDEERRSTLQQSTTDAKLIATQLVAHAEDALQARKPEVAEHYLNLAKPLFPDQETLSRMALLEKRISEYKTVKNRLEMAADLQFNQGLLKRFNDAFRSRDLLTAQRVMAQILAQEVRPPDTKILAGKLEQAIEERVKEALVTGRSLYSHGKIEDAVKVWRDALPLQPDNRELKEHIERAERVLEKLRKLSPQPKTGAKN